MIQKIMRKKYMIPHVNVVTVETQNLMDASGPYMEIDPDDKSETNESKQHNYNVWEIWDDGSED